MHVHPSRAAVIMLLRHPHAIALMAFALAYTAFAAWYGTYVDFQQSPTATDFWGNRFVAAHLTDAMPQSLYNGFFPLGYHVFLRSIMHWSGAVVGAYIANTLFGLLVVLAIMHLCSRVNGLGHGVLCAAVLALWPSMFRYSFAGGADAGSVAFFTLGVLLLWPLIAASRETAAVSLTRFAFAGLSLGLAAQWRYHALVAGLMLLGVGALVSRRTLAGVVVAGLALGAVYAPQMAVSLMTGHGPLETSNQLNVYNLMYRANWFHVTEFNLPRSIVDVIAQDPWRFVRNYSLWMITLLPYAVPAWIVAFRGETAVRRIALAWALFATAYALVFGISASPRAALLVTPISCVFLVTLYRLGYDAIRRRGRFAEASAALLVALVLGALAAADAVSGAHRKERASLYRALEAYLLDHGVTQSRQLYTSDLHFYFRRLDPPRPQYNGGWVRIETLGFGAYHPEFSVSDPVRFVAECRQRRVRYVLLSPDAARLSTFLGELYATATPPFVREKQVRDYRIYRVGP